MASDRVFGSVDRYWVDPATGAHVLAGWASDEADPANRGLTVQFVEDGAVIGEALAQLRRDDGFHGFVVPCQGGRLGARAAGGGVIAVARAPDGRKGRLNWHKPFLDSLAVYVPPLHRLAAGAVHSVRIQPGGIELCAGGLYLRITAVRDDIVRIRMAAAPDWTEDVSWAVLDPARRAAVPVTPLSEHAAAGFTTARLAVRVMRATGRILITTLDGAPVCVDAEMWPAASQNGGFSIHTRKLPGQKFFGLGDQPGPLDRTGGAFTLWNTDVNCYQESESPLYKSVPFFMGVRPGAACGILLDSSWRSQFDFGRARRDVVSFGAEGGPADYYVMQGADAGAVLRSYAHLTGLPPLPPLWAFGFQQSRYSYMSQDAVLAVADGLRSHRFPADVIYCDIDYQDRYRPFTVNTATFPDLAGMVRDLAASGLRAVLITDLHIARAEADYPPYQSGLAGGHFVRDPAGAPYVGQSWPGDAVFPDFTRAATPRLVGRPV